MRPFFRKLIAFITLLLVLQQGIAMAFHSHAVDHAHDPAKSCSICQINSTSKVTLASSEKLNRPIFSFSQTLTIPFTAEAIAIASKRPPARAPPLA